MNNFLKRLFTAVFFTGILLGSVLWNQYSFFALFFIISLLTLHEFYSLISFDQIRPQFLTGYMTSGVLLVTSALVLSSLLPPVLIVLSIPFMFFCFIYELYTKSDKPFVNIAITVFGIIYIAVPFALLLYIPFSTRAESVYHPNIVVGYFFILWANDTGAYLLGMAFGKRKLFERISPKKSWEGSIGGLGSALIVAWCCSVWFHDLNYIQWTITGIIIVVTGTFGDLSESLLKRSLNIKDSGKILPGHGGLLDRFDALLVSVPFVTAYLVLINTF